MAGMARGSGSERIVEPNLIPMIDVLLVMIVIFLILNGRIRQALDLQIPPAVAAARRAPPTQIVLELLPSAGFAINGQPVTAADLDRVVAEIFAQRASKLLFVKSAPDRTYAEVVDAIDRARGAGVQVFGMVPRRQP